MPSCRVGAAGLLLRALGQGRWGDPHARRRWGRRAVRRQFALRDAARLRVVLAVAGWAAPGRAGPTVRPPGYETRAAAAQGCQLHLPGQHADARPTTELQPA